jgi:UDP-N-acetyl-D-glucosamine dehydrogenase
MLKKKILNKTAVIGIFGLGYIGLPRCLKFTKAGFKVIGFDIDANKINLLNKGKSYISDIKDYEIQRAINNNFNFTTDYSLAKKLDVIIMCLPTPLVSKGLTPDLSYIKNTISRLVPFLKKQQLVSLESTSYPGTTRELILPKISKFNVGKDFFLVYSPEREDPGRKSQNLIIPKIVTGYSKKCLELGSILYKNISKKTVLMDNLELGEMTKLYENIFRSVNIGLVNEIKKICIQMKLNIFDIINAANTKPFGFYKFLPGPGLGGHCIPIDPFYLQWKAKQMGIKTQFIHLAGVVNRSMPSWIIKKLENFLKERNDNLKSKKILLLGLAYKKNVNDCRESPAFNFIEILKKKGSQVYYTDKYISKVPKLRDFDIKLKSIQLNKKKIREFDIIIIVTDHDYFDYKLIMDNAKLIVDTRGVYKIKADNILSL